jgi:hypothetical protein
VTAWGRKVSKEFVDKVAAIAIDLDIPPDWLMACMAFESAESFMAGKLNLAGSGAVGLIQFMPATAKALGTSTAALAAMSAEDQLTYVAKYFRPYHGRLATLEDVYMAILWPLAVGKDDGYILFDVVSKPTTYRQNAGLDLNKDGKVTKYEAAAKVRAALQRGLLLENATEN